MTRSVLFLWAVFAIGVLLTGCNSVEDQQAQALKWWANIATTASGAVQAGREAVEQSKDVVEDTKRLADDLGRRADAVQDGIGKIREGKKLIEAGLGGTGSAK